MPISIRKILLRIIFIIGTSKISVNRYGIESRIKIVIQDIKKTKWIIEMSCFKVLQILN